MFIKADHKNLKYSGRIDDRDKEAPVFVFPCTSVTVRFRGTGISVYLENKKSYWDNYMGILLDGAQSKLCISNRNTDRYLLAEKLADTQHELILFKRQDSCHEVTFRGFEFPEGTELLEPLPRPVRRMEVYGDSVSAGEVSEAVEYTGAPDPEHNGEYSNSWYSYAWMTARRLNAELHDVAQGGIALLDGTGWFAAPTYVGMETAWNKVHYNPELSESTEWDFSRYTPHVVVVAIGQNDNYPEDYMKENPAGEKAGRWKWHYRIFVEGLRKVYPKALIVLTTTVLQHDANWDAAIDQVCRELGDPKIVHFLYSRNGRQTPGHIRIGEAEQMSEELAFFIERFGTEIWE